MRRARDKCPLLPEMGAEADAYLRPLFIRTLGGKTDVSVCVRLFVSIASRGLRGSRIVPQVRRLFCERQVFHR